MVPTRWLPNASEVGLTLSIGSTPVPVTPIVSGLLSASLTTDSSALAGPSTVGENVIANDAADPIASAVAPSAPANGPDDSVAEVMCSVSVPTLVIVTGSGALVDAGALGAERGRTG